MRRLIIHAGFPKTGSSSIQHAIGLHIEELRAQGIYMFGKNMQIEIDGKHPGLPMWFLEDAAKNRTSEGSLSPTVLKGFELAGRDSTLIISSENLSQSSMPPLFTGIDNEVNVELVFYLRPQIEWIPSAWKQWSMKIGLSLEKFVEHCLSKGRPAFLSEIQGWDAALPNAKISVRPFFPNFLTGGNPPRDFFNIVGFENYNNERINEQINSSVDYSILHTMMRNSKNHFSSIHDIGIENNLAKILPKKYKKTNAIMLSNYYLNLIEKHYRNENLSILNNYTKIDDVKKYYSENFVPIHSDVISYMEMDEGDILTRCFALLKETVGNDRAVELLGNMLSELARD